MYSLNKMDKYNYALQSATNIYNHYYKLAIKEFNNEDIANMLAKIPADYIYNELLNKYPNCYINEGCCLEYCNELLDHEFDRLDPDIKTKVYEKAFGVSAGNISPGEINLKLKKGRKIKGMYQEKVNQLKSERENDIIYNMSGLVLGKRKSEQLENVFKTLRLN